MIKSIKIKIFFLILISQSKLAFAENISETNDIYVIPLEIVSKTAYVDIEIEHKKLSVVFDLGASTPISLCEKVTDELKDIIFSDDCIRYTDATGKVHCEKSFIIKKANSGKYCLNNLKGKNLRPWGIHIVTTNDSHENNELENDLEEGIVGYSFFKESELIIDYPHKNLKISKRNDVSILPKEMVCYEVAFVIDQNGLVFEAQFDNKMGKFLLDTGATGSILRKKDVHVNAEKQEVENFIVAKNNLGKYNFWAFDFPEPNVDGVLGYDFFEKNIVHINFINHKLAICPVSSV